MVCYNPRQAFYIKNLKTSKKRVVFPNHKIRRAVDAIDDDDEVALGDLVLPCSYCVGCKTEYARQWSVRCMHEASNFKNNCFVTLTYDNFHLPKNGSLNKKHFSGFMKRLRQRLYRRGHGRIKFFHSGEYGDKMGRPHYHALIFGYDFPDKVLHSSRRGCDYYESQMLAELWPYGRCVIGAVTMQSAGYVARYALKKRYGSAFAVARHYRGRIPEYSYGSNGLGRDWIMSHIYDVYAYDRIVIMDAKNKPVIHKPPRYYDEQLKKINPELYLKIKIARENRAESREVETPERLRAREFCKIDCISRLYREYDEECAAHADICDDDLFAEFTPVQIDQSG